MEIVLYIKNFKKWDKPIFLFSISLSEILCYNSFIRKLGVVDEENNLSRWEQSFIS